MLVQRIGIAAISQWRPVAYLLATVARSNPLLAQNCSLRKEGIENGIAALRYMICFLQLKCIDEETYLQSAEGVRFLPWSKSLLAKTDLLLRLEAAPTRQGPILYRSTIPSTFLRTGLVRLFIVGNAL